VIKFHLLQLRLLAWLYSVNCVSKYREENHPGGIYLEFGTIFRYALLNRQTTPLPGDSSAFGTGVWSVWMT
jgi:hypothetical protein